MQQTHIFNTQSVCSMEQTYTFSIWKACAVSRYGANTTEPHNTINSVSGLNEHVSKATLGTDEWSAYRFSTALALTVRYLLELNWNRIDCDKTEKQHTRTHTYTRARARKQFHCTHGLNKNHTHKNTNTRLFCIIWILRIIQAQYALQVVQYYLHVVLWKKNHKPLAYFYCAHSAPTPPTLLSLHAIE